jgi:hypothetical protein
MGNWGGWGTVSCWLFGCASRVGEPVGQTREFGGGAAGLDGTKMFSFDDDDAVRVGQPAIARVATTPCHRRRRTWQWTRAWPRAMVAAR